MITTFKPTLTLNLCSFLLPLVARDTTSEISTALAPEDSDEDE